MFRDCPRTAARLRDERARVEVLGQAGDPAVPELHQDGGKSDRSPPSRSLDAKKPTASARSPSASWAVYSFALERNIAVCLVDARVDPSAGLLVRSPDGPRRGEPHPIPFV
jgi:hypothetical protein